MKIGLGIYMGGMWGGINPSAALLAALSDGAAQVIMHPLEYGSMFQDRAGTTPVTESGQLVGLALDWGLTGAAPVPTGPELVTNGGFDTATGWTLGTGWSISGGTLNANVPSGFTDTRGTGANQAITEAGKTYEVSFDLTVVSGGIRIFLGGVPDATTLSTSGRVTRKIAATNANYVGWVAYGAGGTFVGTIDNVSVRELPGHHATAVSDAARGVFRDVGGKRWIEYNGVNTAYQTPALPAPGVDKAQVFAGVRKLSDAAVGMVVELSSALGGNSGTFLMSAPNSTAANYGFNSRGTILNAATLASSYAAPITNVLTGIGDIAGDLATLRVNGAQVAQSTSDQGAGNFNPSGTYPLYYGARAGTSLFFNGHHYRTLGPIVRFGTSATPEQIAAAEAYYTAGLPS